jgi:cytochrome c oxidase subunit 3
MAERLTEAERRKVRKPMLWIGLASITMTFAGLTSGYVVSRSSLIPDNRWLEFSLPHEFYYATVAILLSSLFMVLAKRTVKQSKSPMPWLVAALLGAFAFVFLQLLGANTLVEQGLYFSGSSTSVSWVYVIAGLHWFHVVSGIIVLIVTIYQAQKGNYTSKSHYGLDLSAIYWHFLDLLWIYLFCFLAFIR